MATTEITNCDDCPLWNADRDWCQHPDCPLSEFWKSPTKNEYFAGCPLKKESLRINLIENNKDAQ